MARKAVSRRKLDLVDTPPRFVTNHFASATAAGEPVVVPMITMVDKMEAYLSAEDANLDICRAFLTVAEAKAYWMYVCNHTGLPPKAANFWVTDSDGLVLHLISLAKTRKRKIKCFGSAIHDHRIFDLETFWTNNAQLMV